MPGISFDSKNQAVSAIPRAFQLALASLAATTGVKSAAYSMGRWRFTESLGRQSPRRAWLIWARQRRTGFVAQEVALDFQMSHESIRRAPVDGGLLGDLAELQAAGGSVEGLQNVPPTGADLDSRALTIGEPLLPLKGDVQNMMGAF